MTLRCTQVERPKPGASMDASGEPAMVVECEWGKAEAPPLVLPPSLQCSPTTPGVMANGAPVLGNGAQQDAGGGALSSVVMATCQVRWATVATLLR
jgi:hypothetical protein